MKIFITLTTHFKDQCSLRGNRSVSYYVRIFRKEIDLLGRNEKMYIKKGRGVYGINWMKYQFVFRIEEGKYIMLTFIDKTK